MTSELIKKQLEELTTRIEKVESNIVKSSEQVEQLKSEKFQLIGAYQMATSVFQTLKKEEEDVDPKITIQDENKE